MQNVKLTNEAAYSAEEAVTNSFGRVKSAARRLFLGTSATTFPTAGDYKTKILWIPISSYWFTVAIAVAYALYLFYSNFLAKSDRRNGQEFLTVDTFIELGTLFSLIIGLLAKNPLFLLPARILCGFLRLCFFLIISAAIIAGCVECFEVISIYFYQSKASKDRAKYRRDTFLPLEYCLPIVLIFLAIGFYYFIGLVAEAITKCVSQMRREKTKTE